MKKFQKVYIEITNICNLRCDFCPQENRPKESMCPEDFEYVAKQVCEYTDLITLHVKGEPLIHPCLKEILDICEKYNLMVNITTNGTLFEDTLEILLNSKAVRQINVSLHSITQNINNDMYNVNTYLDNVLKYTKILLDKTDIIISYRLWNLEKLEQNDENKEILRKIEDFYKVDDLYNRAKTESFVKLGERVFLNQDIEFTWPNINGKVIAEEGKCWGLRNQIAILVDGTVVPCCLDQDGIINLGNIFDEKLDTILNSELATKIAKGFENKKLEHELCKRCGFRTKFD